VESGALGPSLYNLLLLAWVGVAAFLLISSSRTTVPDLMGMKREQASSALGKAGL